MARHRPNKDSSLDYERATRTRVSDKDRVRTERKRHEREDNGDEIHGRTDDLKGITDSRHRSSGGKRYKEESRFSVREPVRKARERSSDKDKSTYRYKKENNETVRYRDEKYQDKRPKEKSWDADEREKHYYRDEHKYAEERKGTKYRDEVTGGMKRLYIEKVDFGDLKGRNAKEMRGEMDKYVPRTDKRKVEYLPRNNCCKSKSKSDTILSKGHNRNNNLRQTEGYAQKRLSPIPEEPNLPIPSHNNKSNTYPTETLIYSQACFHKTKDNLTEELTHRFSSSRCTTPSMPSNSNNWNRDKMVPFHCQGFQRPDFQPRRGGNSVFYNYRGWENNYNNCNTNINGNNNSEYDSWSQTARFHSTIQQSSFGIRSETSEWTLPIQVSYNSHGEMNLFPSNPNKPTPNSAFPNLESAEPKKADNMGPPVSASDRPPDRDAHSSMKNDRSKEANFAERTPTPFPYDYYLSKIGVSSDLVPHDLNQRCTSVVQKRGADGACGFSCPEKLRKNDLAEKGATQKGSNGILKYIFPNRTNAIFEKSLSLYISTTGKCTEPNQPATSVSLGEGQNVAYTSTSTDKMEIDAAKEDSANSDKKHNVAVPDDDSMEMELTSSIGAENESNFSEFDMMSRNNVVLASGAKACEVILSQMSC